MFHKKVARVKTCKPKKESVFWIVVAMQRQVFVQNARRVGHANKRTGRGQRSASREREREAKRARCESCVQSCAFTADKVTNGLYVQDKALSALQKSAYPYFTNHTTRQALPHKNAFVVKHKTFIVSLAFVEIKIRTSPNVEKRK